MNEPLAQWLRHAVPFQGALACAVRSTDGEGAACSWSSEFTEPSLENAMRCAADLFQVIQYHRITSGRVRWVFGQALLHCERRADGTCFGVFTARSEDAFDAGELERLFASFRAEGQPGPIAM